MHAQTTRHQHRLLPSLVCISVLLALVGVLVTTSFHHENPALPTPEPVIDPSTVPYIEQWGNLNPTVKRNSYDKAGFFTQDGRIHYSDTEYIALQGVDVSDHNGAVDWASVQANNIDYAIVRLGYRGYGNGALVTDQRFLENAAALEQLGMDYGIYFFSQCISIEEAEEEARYILSVLDGLHPTLPVYFDWEPISDSARTAEMELSLLTDCALAFCQILEQAGLKTGIYFNQEYGYLHYDLDRLSNQELWLAEYAQAPSFYYHFHQWQYSCTGSIPGIDTVVDFNLRFIPSNAFT